MKNRLFILFSLCLVLIVSSNLFAWGSATHAYMAKELGNRTGFRNLQEMYGAMVPDFFNLMYNNTLVRDYMWGQTHFNAETVYIKAGTCAMKSMGFGFVSHNLDWGADSTASEIGFGYVDAKIPLLAPGFEAVVRNILIAHNIDPDEENLAQRLAVFLADVSIETAVDIQVKEQLDQQIGYRIYFSAAYRNWRTPWLLVSSYASGLANFCKIYYLKAAEVIIRAEKTFRDQMKDYGLLFMQNQTVIIQQLSQQGAELATVYLSALGYPDVNISSEFFIECIEAAMYVTYDCVFAVGCTIDFLSVELAARDIETCESLFAKNTESESEFAVESVPKNFSLEQNMPNPFNPVTRIRYALPQDSRVRLVVYNTIGQNVAVLVDGFQPAGVHEATWYARNLPSGCYFYTLEAAGSFRQTRRMFLTK